MDCATGAVLLRRQATIDDELQAGESDLRLRPDIERFDTVDVQALDRFRGERR